MFTPDFYYSVVYAMLVLAVIVFIALYFVTPAYGMTYSKKWGPSVNNRVGWVLMEAPVFFAMLAFWLSSDRAADTTRIVMVSLFLFHYFQRSFIFPLLMRGRSRMPLAIAAMGITFNLINSYMIGGWLFYVSPADMYGMSWLASPQFIIGTIIFFGGMAINWHSDYIIRHLRKPGDSGHYIPRGGAFKYVTGANYFGEIMEWTGYAILTWSLGGVAFAVWTFANLAPRARTLHGRYIKEFGSEYANLNRKYVIPYIY